MMNTNTTNINSILNTNKSKKHACGHCQCCNKVTDFLALPMKDRGGRNAYLCEECTSKVFDYCDENSSIYGVEKVHPYTFSIELEVSAHTDTASLELSHIDYLPTSDCTVECEFKSPIYNGFNALSKHATQTIAMLLDDNEIEMDWTCGTHFNVGVNGKINEYSIAYIARYYRDLFIPLSNAMKEHPITTERIYGRNFSTWAEPCNAYTYPYEHCNFINIQHTTHIEHRLCKYVTGEQYAECMRYCRKLTEIIINNFVDYLTVEIKDTNRYPDRESYLKHKAEVTAKKLVNEFLKRAR